ncbi:MAG: hypothetical protein Q9219_007302 [cf. Caloplaca sp. 3 TL-2023]
MPSKAKNQGTDKHFYCVSVTEFDKPAIIYETADCTGKSCFIPGAGQWRTWANGARANCIDIDNKEPVNVPPCLAAGQNGRYPPNGGFPSDITEWVGGIYGLPAAFTDSHVCSPVPDNAWPPLIPRDSFNPPIGDLSQQYQSSFPAAGDFDPNDLGKRSIRWKHWERANEIRALTTTGSIRRAYPYQAAWYAAVTQQVWWFIGAGGVLLSQKIQHDQTAATAARLNVDHVVEISMIIEFVSQAFNPGWGISQNQWITIQDFIASNGARAENAPNGDRWCAVFDQFASYVGGLSNLRGTAMRINTMKMEAINAVLPGAAAVTAGHWQTRCTVEEARAVGSYFSSTFPQAKLAAASIGAALDVIAGSTPTQAISKAFVSWTVGIWANAMYQIQTYPGL